MSRRKGDPGACDELFSRLVRSRGRCRRCHNTEGPFDTAHIIGRRYSATRCELDNAWCLCRTCHQLVDQWWFEKESLVKQTIGLARYFALVRLAQAGIQLSSAAFWRAERERLVALCQEQGIDTRRRIPT